MFSFGAQGESRLQRTEYKEWKSNITSINLSIIQVRGFSDFVNTSLLYIIFTMIHHFFLAIGCLVVKS